jgi:hypothetical protein
LANAVPRAIVTATPALSVRGISNERCTVKTINGEKDTVRSKSHLFVFHLSQDHDRLIVRFNMKSFITGLAALAAAVLPVDGAAPYCLPGNACFPSQRKLEQFNNTIGGNLIKATPYGAECYGSTYNAEACAALAAQKRDPEYRIELPGR